MRRLAWSLTVVAMLGIGMVGMGGCGQDEPSFRPASIGEGRASAQDRQRPSRPAQEEGARIPQGIEEAGPTVTEVQGANAALLDPRRATERAPEVYTVELDTTEGPIQIEVHRAWAPNGADRFYNLVRIGFFTDVSFFRVVEGFMAQAGIHGRADVNAAWRSANIPDDPVVEHNVPGMVSYAMGGPNTRTTQFFINLVDNRRLDPMGFAPFGRVREQDMAVVRRLHAGYGEGAPAGRGPMQARIQREGNAYLRAEFPELDSIRSARIIPNAGASGGREAGPRPPG